MTGEFEGLVRGAPANATCKNTRLVRLHLRQRWAPNAQVRPVDAPVEDTLWYC